MVFHNFGKTQHCQFGLHRKDKTWIQLEPTYHSLGRLQKPLEPERPADTKQAASILGDNKARVPVRTNLKNCQTYQKNRRADSKSRLGLDPDIDPGCGFWIVRKG